MKKEKKIIGSADPVNIASTKTILDQMIHGICKMKIKGSTGTGFFCKIHLGNNQTMNCLMTNYHVLDEKYYKENKEINLLLNEDKEVKTINTKLERKTYFNKEYDITIIELKQIDNISNVLELDENLFIDKTNFFFADKSIYILQYPKGKDAAVSYGQLKGFYKYNIKHTCSTDYGSSGSPILNLENNKVIGIHKECSSIFNYNQGTFLKYPLNCFISQNKSENLININNITMSVEISSNNQMNNNIINSSELRNDGKKTCCNENYGDHSDIKGDNNKKISPYIICPICKETAKYKIKDYKIKIYNCKKKHIVDDILFKDFENTQIIDESLILCDVCKINKNKTYNNEMYLCNKCNVNLCPLCKYNHSKNHKIINYDQKNYICNIHNKEYNSYCKTCKIDICEFCKIGHKKHEIILYINFMQKILNNEDLLFIKAILKMFHLKISLIIDRFNNVMENLEIYYKLIENLFLNYNIDNINYNILHNICSQKKFDQIDYFLGNLIKFTRDNTYKKFIPRILKMYNKMNKNEIDLIYNITDVRYYTKIFGDYFVRINKDLCRIQYNGKEYNLIKGLPPGTADVDNKNRLTIKLIGINNVSNISFMFEDCSDLSVLSNLSNWDTTYTFSMNGLFKN